MFSNLISTKDLFSYPRHAVSSRNETADASLSCSQNNSQYLNSQVEFSQTSSYQDSQVLSQSQSQSQSPGRKMYQKYMSKGSLFKQDGSQASHHQQNPTKLSHQQLQQANKTRARERDERDLLHSIVSIVGESSNEVKEALQSFRESIERRDGSNDKNLSSSFKKLSDDLTRSCDKILDTMKERDSIKVDLHKLETELARRDSTIKELERQLKEAQKQDDERIVSILQDSHLQQQEMLEKKLQKLLNVTSEQLKLYDKQASWQNEQETEQQQLQRQIFKEQQSLLKHLEDRLKKEMESLHEDFEEKQIQLANYYKKQLQEFHSHHTADMDLCITQKLTEGLKQASRETSSMFTQQRLEIDSTCERHRQELERFVKSQLQKQLTDYERKIGNALSNIQMAQESGDDQEQSKQSKTVTLERSDDVYPVENTYSKGMWSTIPLRKSKPGNGPTNSDTTAQNGYTCDFGTITIKSPDFNLTSSYSYSRLPRSTSNSFVSPWNSKNLFAKANPTKPSPVATVPPLGHPAMENRQADIPAFRPTAGATLPQPEVPTYDPPQLKERKKKGIVLPQRRSQRLSTHNKDEPNSNSSSQQNSLSKIYSTRMNNARKVQRKLESQSPDQIQVVPQSILKSDVYSFEFDAEQSEKSPELCQKLQYGASTMRKGPKDAVQTTDSRNKRKLQEWNREEPDWLKVARFHTDAQPENSPSAESTRSHEAAPSVSMMEVVVKRRVKRDRTPLINTDPYQFNFFDPDKNSTLSSKGLNHMRQSSGCDLLSTPCFRSYNDTKEDDTNTGPVVWAGKMNRKETGKRKLCDFSYDTQITEITKSIRKHLQRVKPSC